MTRILIRCGWIITLDPALGELRDAEILVQDGRIATVGRNLGATAEEVVDATSMIVMPGLIDAHVHLWQCGLRAIGSEWLGPDYHGTMHANLATRYGAEDNYLGNLVSALAHLDGGVTTVLDWCHNITSLEMAERSVDALEESGIRAVFAHGTAKPPTRPGETPYTHVPHPRDRVEALRKSRFASDDRRVTLALAVLGPHWGTLEVAEADLRLARELGLLSTSHATKPRAACVAPGGYEALAEKGLLGPDHNIVHGNYFGEEELDRILDTGASITSTVMTELHGHAAEPLVVRVHRRGHMPSIGIDVEPINSGEMFREMQAALLFTRHAAHRDTAAAGKPPLKAMPIRSREALTWATIGNARAIGLEDRIGSLTPGKLADLIMLRAQDLNLFPVHDPVHSAVEQAGAGNVDSVMVGGVFRKRHGRLLFDEAVLRQRKSQLVESAARILREGGHTPKAL
ncbi:amidohydrolase family protein [Falsiroseomonas oryzae]|uniref:amidohydrolase family protein n=1 Tax=Falsiroseomonas oryzae TaxID=2766473 RepID=UPI0022EB2F95|nr:amidohydrolase family protein [Roseomonas sp. MO-31]